jgi:hypothetical protein
VSLRRHGWNLQNPCKGKWNLADTAIEYKHSSSKYYATGEHAEYVVTNYKELYDIDLSR